MQPLLMIDYLEGRVPSKKKLWGPLSDMAKILTTYCTIKDPAKGIHYSPQSPKFLISILESDTAMRMFFYSYLLYREGKGKNYVIGKDLSKALRKTKLDVKASSLPDNFNGFVYIPDETTTSGFPLKGAFVHIRNKWVTIGAICTEKVDNVNIPCPMFINVDVTGKETVSEALEEHSTKISNIDGSFEIDPLRDKINEKNFLSAVIYICNTDEKLVEEVNSFSKKKSKSEGEKRNYTQLPFIRVGFNFRLPKNFSVDHSVVSGFFRWQHHGPGNTLLKYIYIEPFVRTYNNN